MIRLDTNTIEFANDLAEVMRLFYPGEAIASGERGEGAWLAVRSETQVDGGQVRSAAALWDGAQMLSRYEHAAALDPEAMQDATLDGALALKRARKHAAKIALYRALRRVNPGALLPWGSLTGIRPTKFAREIAARQLAAQSRESSWQRVFADDYDVSPGKIALVEEVLRVQQPLLANVPEDAYDVYIGIPFCKTRCLYCSFASAQYGANEFVEPYLSALAGEIRRGADLMREYGRRLRCLYVGGGTPTALSRPQLEAVLQAALAAFGQPVEFTVEAGRPDTVDADKLSMLRSLGVGRISINPQSMNVRTLEIIGRSHTPGEIARSYELAREIGFDSINMDLIAGLPGEDEAMFESTLREIEAMAPDNLTVHTLAVKRSSRLKEQLDKTPLPGGETVAKMLEAGAASAARMGMRPYYLYRQKYMSGNLENTGYATAGAECLYNVGIMEERVSVLALGSGAISKWVSGSRLERQPNPVDFATYIGGIDGIIDEKKAMIESLRK